MVKQPQESAWSVPDPRVLTFQPGIDELQLRLAHGAVNIVGTDEPTARVEVAEVEGQPVRVRRQGRLLTVGYDDLPWSGFLNWFERGPQRRRAVVSVSVSAATRLSVGVVGATAVISRISGPAEVRGVSGSTTLVGLSGGVRTETVSGDVEAQSLSGELAFRSVSGHLTVVDCASRALTADSVSGTLVLDLAPVPKRAAVRLSTVSGEIAVRLPEQIRTTVTVNSASGSISSAFPELPVGGSWAGKRLTGTLGAGAGGGRIQCTSVSGPVALLRRPTAAGEPVGATPGEGI